MDNTKHYSTKDILKFIILSSIGVFLFLVPIKAGGGFNIPIGIIIDVVKSYIHDYTMIFMVVLVTINAVLSSIAYFSKPKFITDNPWLENILVTTPLYLASRIIGAIIILGVYFQIGPEVIISSATGESMVGLARSLVSILLVISYTMPLLTEFGVMEFVGILIKDFVRPLFRLPGRSAVNLMTSWLGASNAAVLLTEKQYNEGYYTDREAGIIMTNFSLVSIPFCYIVATMINVEAYFTSFYLIITAVGILLAVITPRIPPLSTLPNNYHQDVGQQSNEEVPEGKTKLQFALESAAIRAKSSKVSDVISQGNDMLFSVIFGLAPIIIAWGTVSLILVEYTPIFKILSYPLGFYMQLLGVEEAFAAAPATLVGFADMFIPPLVLANIASIKTKFIVGALSLVQIIYLTEVGAIIIQSDVSLNMKELFIIFLQRTIIAIPIIVFLANIFVF